MGGGKEGEVSVFGEGMIGGRRERDLGKREGSLVLGKGEKMREFCDSMESSVLCILVAVSVSKKIFPIFCNSLIHACAKKLDYLLMKFPIFRAPGSFELHI